MDYGYDDSGGGAESVWHVVIDQDQVGPLSVAEVQKRFAAGEIDADSYIWREGFSDWLPISQVDAFATLFNEATSAGGDDSGALFGASSGSGSGAAAVNDLFSGVGDTRASSESDDDGDVFAARRPAPAAAASASAADGKLRGERGENSVLFSLSNLAQLASDTPRQTSSSSSSSSSSGSAQHGGGEGSGLIDIRSMANAYLSPSDRGGSAKSASPSLGSASDLPVFSSTGFGEPAVIVPIVRSSASNNNKLIYGLVGLVGVLALIAVVMVVYLIKSDKPPAVAMAPTTGTAATLPGEPAAPTTPTDPTATAPGAATTPPPAPETTAPPPPETVATAPTKSDKPTREPSSKRPERGDSGKKPTSGGKPTKPDEEDKPAKPEKPAGRPSGGGSDCDAVACLVDPNQPCCAKKGGKPSGGNTGGGKVDSNLPEQLDSGMIKAGIDKVKGRAQACGSKSSAKGAVKVRIKATPEGKVGSVDIVSSPDDALASCVASALKGATFAKTQRGMGFAYTLSF